MISAPLPRIDLDEKLQELLLPYCRLKSGEIWKDPAGKHKVGCVDVSNEKEINKLIKNDKAVLAVQDPPYNFVAFGRKEGDEFIDWSREWIKLSYDYLKNDASIYIWLGADQNEHFSPLPQFMLMMNDSGFESKSLITMRNQRGYGTQKNWMAIRQELLFYIKGNPKFNIEACYTDIPKVLNGYYKNMNGEETSNFDRSKSAFIRAGNVWIDIQQVFYRMEENVNGCFAQKPLKAIERIIQSASEENETVLDFFSHAGTTLIASEKLNRKCLTTDINPVFCEITIRRLENFRKEGKTGWQNSNPFLNEIIKDKKLKNYLKKEYEISYNEIGENVKQ
jgi:DNA modification methylase